MGLKYRGVEERPPRAADRQNGLQMADSHSACANDDSLARSLSLTGGTCRYSPYAPASLAQIA